MQQGEHLLCTNTRVLDIQLVRRFGKLDQICVRPVERAFIEPKAKPERPEDLLDAAKLRSR